MNVMDGNEWRMAETRKARPVSWVKAAFNEFGKFPEGVRSICVAALTIAAECGKDDIAKPMQGMWSGILEIALPFKGDAFRVVYSVQLSRKSGCCMLSRRNRRRESRRSARVLHD